MRPCPHSRSSLLYQSAQSPAAFLQSQPQPRKLQRGPSTPHEVRQSPPLHICSFSCHLYVYALSKNQGKFCTTLWACRMISQTERQRWSLIKKDLYKKKLACQKLCQCRCSHLILESVFPSIYIKSVLISLLSPHPLTHTHTPAKQAQPIKRPIQIGPKVSIQPKPLITAVPLAHAPAPLQAKTIIIQPLQTTVLPVVKPAPVNIQPAPPPGQSSHCNTLRHTHSYCTASGPCPGYIGRPCRLHRVFSNWFFI